MMLQGVFKYLEDREGVRCCKNGMLLGTGRFWYLQCMREDSSMMCTDLSVLLPDSVMLVLVQHGMVSGGGAEVS